MEQILMSVHMSDTHKENTDACPELLTSRFETDTNFCWVVYATIVIFKAEVDVEDSLQTSYIKNMWPNWRY